MRENSWQHIPRVRKYGYEGVRWTSARGSLGSTRGDSSRVACSFADVVTRWGKRQKKRKTWGERREKGSRYERGNWWGSTVNVEERWKNFKSKRKEERVNKTEKNKKGERELKRKRKKIKRVTVRKDEGGEVSTCMVVV